jgi:hypothetical protein
VITLLLAVLVIGFFTFRHIFDDSSPDDFIEWLGSIFISTVFTGVISLIPFTVLSIIGSNTDRVMKLDRDYPLVALRERDGVEGHFFLGSGSISDKQYYFWYRQDGNFISGGKTEREPSVHIHEGDYKPFMRTWKAEYKNPWVAKHGWLFSLDLRDTDWYSPDFYIPTGSIQQGYGL